MTLPPSWVAREVALATRTWLLLACCCVMVDALLWKLIGTEPFEGALAAQLLWSTLGHSLALCSILLLASSVAFSLAGPLATESRKGRCVLALCLGLCVVLLDLSTWPLVRAPGDLTKLRALLDLFALSLLAAYVLRPAPFREKWLPPFSFSMAALGVVTISLCFGTTLLPIFPKLRRGQIAGLILMTLLLCWLLRTLQRERPAQRLLFAHSALACVGFLLATPLATLAGPRATQMMVDTLEASRSLRMLHRRLLSLPLVESLDADARLRGKFPMPVVATLPKVNTEAYGRGEPGGARLVRCAPSKENATARSVLLLSVDSLRSDYYGLPQADLPHITSLRTSGIYFPAAMQACSGTAGSLYAMHTGRYINAEPKLTDGFVDLASAIGADYEFWIQGWQHERVTESAEAFSKRILTFIATTRQRRRPFLAHAHYMSTHITGGLSGLAFDHRGKLIEVDAAIGSLIEGLRRQDALQSTIIIVVGDHGEDTPAQRGYLGHGFGVWDSTLLTPLILWTHDGAATTRRERASGTDIFPTILEMLGCGADYEVHGRSLLKQGAARALYASSYSPNPAVDSLIFSDKHAVVLGKHKLTVDRWDNAWALYDLVADPAERHNTIEDQPAIAARLRLLLDGYLAGHAPQPH